MSRKHPSHSSLMINFLNKNLPKGWKILNLNNLNEKSVYQNLLRSKIFLAYSNLEGLPLPPIEAALTGNYVIGYTGEGGKDYWKKPIFTEIYTGDLKNFDKKIFLKIKNIKKNKKSKNFQQKKIKREFSQENEILHIKKFLRFVK